jgi:GAF domain-containing protein
MDETPRIPAHDALAQAQETITRQGAEIERLRVQLRGAGFAEELRGALAVAGAAGTLLSPPDTQARLLEMIVQTAAHVLSARAASLFLVDEEAGELVFEVALGEKGEHLKKMRLPLGHGIAGLVALSGQPLAVADARRDPRHARDIAEIVGYQPQTILCVPLTYHDQVIGVLELLDKEGAPTFSAADMESLGLFANQAAVAIEQSRVLRSLAGLVVQVLSGLGGVPKDQGRHFTRETRAYIEGLEGEDTAYRQTLELAQLVQQIAWQGEHEATACQAILRAFAVYLTSRAEPEAELGVLF